MKLFTFIGCSFTVGVGLPDEKLDENNYTNLVTKHFNATVNNLSIGGNNNYDIFLSSVNELLFNNQDVLFVQWSELSRFLFHPHLDLEFQVPSCISNNTDISYLDLKLSNKFLKKFGEQFLLVNHDYNNILTLLNYCKILESIAQHKKIKIVFINGLLPWTSEILDEKALTNPSKNFSEYTKNLLSVDLLPDEDIIKFFNKIKRGLDQINLNNWTNMFKSMVHMGVDLGTDKIHPGIKSHKLYANMIINHLE